MNNYKLVNNIVGWMVFIIASFVYLTTMEPSVSFWDCGEFISGAYKLQVVHPPGAPMFLLIGRIFTLFASSPENVAWTMNALSAISSAFAVLFLFWTITALSKKIFSRNGDQEGSTIAIMSAGVVGAMSCTFADSFWFSAVEGEVYALSSFFTALVFWAILKWDAVADEKDSNRWLIFIAYMMGVSIGVHLLNLLTIPAIVYVYYYKKQDQFLKYHKYVPFIKSARLFGFLFAGLCGVVILGFLNGGVIPGIPKLMAWFELFFVNNLGLPFSSGITFFLVVLAAGIIFGVYYSQVKGKVLLNMFMLCLTMILIGYSSYFMVVIRSSANPGIDMNNPEEPFNLLSYLLREQYGETPLLKGQYYTAPMIDKEEVGAKYFQDGDKYSVKAKKYKPIYSEHMSGVFPRMWSSQGRHVKFYRGMIKPEYEIRDIRSGRVIGNRKYKSFDQAQAYLKGLENSQGLKVIDKLGLFDHLKFFAEYQIGWMFNRYFLWNFAGRQNDLQGHGGIRKGNWLSGFQSIDEGMRGLAPQDNLPSNFAGNKGMNKFYMLPFLLGLLGMIFHFMKHKEDATIVALLWFFTGIAIIIFLNQYPYQPRERDYAFAGAVYTYCIWIGLGVLFVFDLLRKVINGKIAAIASLLVCFVAVPYVMGAEGWDDHDRSDRTTARDFAINYLESCDKNAILFTQGDNDTYPLWYAQEVEGIRTDIRIVNLSLLAVDWYIDYLKHAINDAGPVPFKLTSDKYRGDKRDYVIYGGGRGVNKKKYYPVDQVMDFIGSDASKTKVEVTSGEKIDFFPSKRLSFKVDFDAIRANNVLSEAEIARADSVMRWDISKRQIYKNDLMVLDLIANNNWTRPIYFAVSVSPDAFVGLQKYFRLEGLAYRLVPVKTKTGQGYHGYINTDVMYENLMTHFVYGGIDKGDVYLDEGILRMCMNLRIQFCRLAEALIKENKKEKAIEVLDRVQTGLPVKNVPYNVIMIQMTELYYKAGATDKGDELAKAVVEQYGNDMNYYMALDQVAIKQFESDMQQAMGIIREIGKFAGKYGDPLIAKEADDVFNLHYSSLSKTYGEPR